MLDIIDIKFDGNLFEFRFLLEARDYSTDEDWGIATYDIEKDELIEIKPCNSKYWNNFRHYGKIIHKLCEYANKDEPIPEKIMIMWY